jgi:flagellin-like hook-associated protein FlgL
MTIAQPGQIVLAQRMVGASFQAQNASLFKLATGLRINVGRDDPAGLISSERLRATLASLDAESRALQRADHVTAVADGALGEISDLLVDAQGLAVANANTGAMSDAERQANQTQLDSIVQSIDRIAATTSFNGQSLLDGTATIRAGDDSLSLDNVAPREIGIVDSDGQTYDLSDVTSGGALNIVDGDVGAALESISTAASQVASMRGELGAFSKNLIGPSLSANAVAIENTAAANSFIRDTDYAAEASALVRSQLLGRTSIFALMQQVSRGESVLSLIG